MKINVALIQMQSLAGDPDRNREKAEKLIRQAAGAEVKPDLIVLPELWTSAFDLGNLKAQAEKCREGAGGRSVALMKALAREYGVYISGGSITLECESGKNTNTNFLFGPDGKILSRYDKAHLCAWVGEDEIMEYGEETSVVSTDIGRIGTVICYDIRFPEWVKLCALNGAEIIIVPASWSSPLNHFRTMAQARAMENQCFVLACAMCAGEGRSEKGHSAVIGPDGTVIAEAENEETVLTAEIDLEEINRIRGVVDYLVDRRPGLYERNGLLKGDGCHDNN